MDRTRSRPSLMARIIETQKRASYASRDMHQTRRRDISFSERYRGTEYETPTPVLVADEPLMSRGRSFVLVLGAAALTVSGAVLVAAPS